MCSSSTSLQRFLYIFKSKYRRKTNIISSSKLLILFILISLQEITLIKCNNETINKCAEGWQGNQCQFCAGKVKLTEPSGVIHDGVGNYSIGIKCSWLIDARDHHSISSNDYIEDKKPVIRLHLEEFATECGWDYLYVYDGDSVEAPLLAVFSGLMYKKNFSIRHIPQVFARSGSALLHFFSDDAYNMSGFNISYKVNACPSISSTLECSGHGVCFEGTCTCDEDYLGPGCNIPKCPNNCSFHMGQGQCERTAKSPYCLCVRGFAGSDCSQRQEMGHWTAVPTTYSPSGSASHGAAIWHETLYIIAGESYSHGNLVSMYDFNVNDWKTPHMDASKIYPEIRYGASTVMYGDKIYLYGGVVSNNGGVSSELWAFDMATFNWENITVKTEQCNSSIAMCGPLKTAGHTATIIPNYENNINNKNSQYMIVIFGHSPQYGYLNTVQEYHFGTKEWKIVNTRGFPAKGGYGHTATWDLLTEKIYVYGGIVSESESTQILNNKLYSYEPASRIWTLLTAAPTARFLHTANFITPGLMLVFGGNTHNDTSHSYGAKCYSQDLLIYDVICDTWNSIEMPNSLYADLSRFGHSAIMHEKSLYIYGGFNGQMLSDMLKYTPGSCSHLKKYDLCLNSYPGHKCIWDEKHQKCLHVTDVQKGLLFSRDQEMFLICRKESRNKMTQQHLLDTERCLELTTCQRCVSTSFDCNFCEKSGSMACVKEKCLDSFKKSLPIKQLEQCSHAAEPVCFQLHSCIACAAFPKICHWDYESSKCRYEANKTIDITEPLPCPPACSALTTCQNCTQEECIWCQKENRCVDKNAYTVSFPYGQCREWTTMSNKCRAVAPGRSECGFYKTCQQCRDDPACGWCDDGSKTGLGTCLPGGDSGPQENNECPEHRWHFTHCPSCQCNGHSTCPDNKQCKQPCGNLTYGQNCEKCKPGYWGNPVNGGQCQKCDCNGQAQFCHSETGKCFCSTKGLAGDHCEKCDATNHYHGDPSKGYCYYDLTIDYQFTFNLSKKEDRHFTQINFRNSPIKRDLDADFNIQCSVAAKMNITIRTAGSSQEKTLFNGVNCSTFRYRFLKTEHNFGIENNVTSTTFYVYVYDFQPPVWIQIAFSQYPKLNLQQFFITFSTCFLLLLLMAAILWKLKQRYDAFRRRQRAFVEMEQMASRPFSQVLVEIETKEYNELLPAVENFTNVSKKRKKDSPSPIALEPCDGNRAAVLSLLVRLPTGGLQHSPPGQSAGLAVASALVTLGNPRRPSIEHLKEPKVKRKQSQHPDSCI